MHCPARTAIVFARRARARKGTYVFGLHRLDCFGEVKSAHVVLESNVLQTQGFLVPAKINQKSICTAQI